MDGSKHGEGTYSDPHGNQYSGQWKNGLPNGLGIHTYKDGKIEEGMFEKGKFLYSKKYSPTFTSSDTSIHLTPTPLPMTPTPLPKLISPEGTNEKISDNLKPYPGTYVATWNNCIGFIWHDSRCLRNQVR